MSTFSRLTARVYRKSLILDGCDEAAIRMDRFSEDVAKLSFPKELRSNPTKNVANDPIIPADLADRVEYHRSTRTMIQTGPLSQRDYHRLSSLNRGDAFGKVFASLQDQSNANCPRVIVTSREPVTLDALDWFMRLRLSPFTDDQLEDFFKRWFAGSEKSHEPIISFLEKHPHIREVCRTPIVATIVAALYENGFDLPVTKTDVYIKRFELLTERWDKIRGVSSRNKIRARDKLFFGSSGKRVQ